MSSREIICARRTSIPTCLRPELARLPRIVYEFDSPDLRTGTDVSGDDANLSVGGVQFAAMFSYDIARDRGPVTSAGKPTS